MIRSAALTALATSTLGLVFAATAHGAVDVVKLNGDDPPTPLVSFTSAKCQKSTAKKPILRFIATAKKNGYELRVNYYKPLAAQRLLTYGSSGGVDVTFEGPEGEFSNLNSPPNAPPGGGAIAFNAKRTKMGIGFSPMLNQSITAGVSFAGGLECKYPKPKKKKRRR